MEINTGRNICMYVVWIIMICNDSTISCRCMSPCHPQKTDCCAGFAVRRETIMSIAASMRAKASHQPQVPVRQRVEGTTITRNCFCRHFIRQCQTHTAEPERFATQASNNRHPVVLSLSVVVLKHPPQMPLDIINPFLLLRRKKINVNNSMLARIRVIASRTKQTGNLGNFRFSSGKKRAKI